MDTDQEWMPQASHSTQNNHQILHYKRLVVPANMRSIYWKCYGFPANDDNEILTKSKIICLLCKSTMTYNRNTTNLRMHLQNKHKNELAALELMQPSPSNKKGDPDKRSIKKPKRPSTGPSAKAGTTQQHPQVVQVFPINNSSTSGLDQAVEKVEPLQNYTMVDGKAIAEAIAEFVILDLQNPDIVEGKGFQRLIGTLKSPCEIPSKALLTDELIPKIYDVVKQQVLQEISTLTVNTSLSIEDWVSSCGDNYSTVSIHFITVSTYSTKRPICAHRLYSSRDNELQTRVLSTIYCSEVDVQHWGAQFDSTMEEFQVKLDKIKGIVVASERDDVRDSLIARGFTVLPCFSHTLQVCSKSVFERSDVQDVVKKCRALVAHISRNSTAMAELRLQDNLIQVSRRGSERDSRNRLRSGPPIQEPPLPYRPGKARSQAEVDHIPEERGSGFGHGRRQQGRPCEATAIRASYVKQNVHLGIIPDRRLRQLVDRLVVEHVPPIVAEAFADCPVVAGLRGAGMRRHGVQVVNAATLFGASDRERDHVQVFQRVGDEVFLFVEPRLILLGEPGGNSGKLLSGSALSQQHRIQQEIRRRTVEFGRKCDRVANSSQAGFEPAPPASGRRLSATESLG
ncbi:unnamed protein product [Nesidiocoris tenuis]|uniref:BED-type domain-containing protein n=1 Tax=Nesidiocoris tenuis TaxID=355587 RepID=A0A6H5GA26_9HEMI|nr:unnamed protein product [Nesidiocoris tenuis]